MIIKVFFSQPGITKKGGFSLKLHPSYKHINMVGIKLIIISSLWSDAFANPIPMTGITRLCA